MKEILEAGGPGLLVPAVLFVLVLYAIRGLHGLHGRRSQYRKEFLELWDPKRGEDDFWLEVSVRHLFGTYLPASVIRIALAHPAKSQSLLDLSELWPLFRYDAETKRVSWQNPRHESLSPKKLRRYLPILMYFVLAMAAVTSGLIAYYADQSALIRWSYSFLSVILLGASFVWLMRADTIKVAVESGNQWIRRINHALTTSQAKHQA